MSEKLTPQQLRECNIRLTGEFDTTAAELEDLDLDLAHVETYQISPEAQAQLDREYIKFLEAKQRHVELLCRQAERWINASGLQNACLMNAVAYLGQVRKQ